MAVGRSLDLQPLKRLNPLNFHISQIWRHRIQHGYPSIVAPCGGNLLAHPQTLLPRRCRRSWWRCHRPMSCELIDHMSRRWICQVRRGHTLDMRSSLLLRRAQPASVVVSPFIATARVRLLFEQSATSRCPRRLSKAMPLLSNCATSESPS